MAMGGNDFGPPDNGLVDDHVIALARAQRGRERPRVCFVGTASGDSRDYLASFYAMFARGRQPGDRDAPPRTLPRLTRCRSPGSGG